MADFIPIIVAFYTFGTGYDLEVQNLIASVKRFNYEYDIIGIDYCGSWNITTFYKPHFIKKMLEKHKRPVLFLDADATIECAIDFNIFTDIDFAGHYAGNFWINTATLFFRNRPETIELLERWIEANNLNNEANDQINLVDVLNRFEWERKIKILNLPREYCSIFDSIGRSVNPIILQHQASIRLAGVRQFYI